MRFENPANGYVEEVTNAPLWCLLFGCIYFAVKGVWTHAIVGALLAIVTCTISWFIYPFFANQIMRTHYLRRGWVEIKEPEVYIGNPVQPRSNVGRNILIALMVLFAISAASLWVATMQDTNGHAITAPISSPPMPHSRPPANSQNK